MACHRHLSAGDVGGSVRGRRERHLQVIKLRAWVIMRVDHRCYYFRQSRINSTVPLRMKKRRDILLSRHFASTRLSLPSLSITCGVPPPLSVRSFIKPSRNFSSSSITFVRLVQCRFIPWDKSHRCHVTYVCFYRYKLTLIWFNLLFTFLVLRISKRWRISWTVKLTEVSSSDFDEKEILHFLKVWLSPCKKYVSHIFV